GDELADGCDLRGFGAQSDVHALLIRQGREREGDAGRAGDEGGGAARCVTFGARSAAPERCDGEHGDGDRGERAGRLRPGSELRRPRSSAAVTVALISGRLWRLERPRSLTGTPFFFLRKRMLMSSTKREKAMAA